MFFNFHNLFRLKVSSNYRLSYLSEIFSGFLAQDRSEFDLELGLGRLKKSHQLKNKWLSVDDSALHIRGWYKGIPWQATFFRENNQFFRIGFTSLLFLEFLALRIIIIPFFQNILGQKGFLLLPSSSFGSSKRIKVLFGLPGCGKSSLLINCCREGQSFISDDYTILNPGGQVFRMLSKLFLRASTFAPSMNMRIKLSKRVSQELKRFIARASGNSISLATQFDPSDIFPGEHLNSAEGPISIFYINRDRSGDNIHCEEIRPEILQDYIMLLEKSTLVWYGNLLSVFGSLSPSLKISHYWERMEKNLTSLLTNSKCYCLSLPSGVLNQTIIEQACSKILSL
jgi:hypothetical protein